MKAPKAAEDAETFINFETDESFLLVHQTRQQSEWLQQYGSTITCMDAVYKTLRYGLPCFFLVVKHQLVLEELWAPSFLNLRQKH